MKKLLVLTLTTSIILFASCKNKEDNASKRGLPSVTGKANEVVVVIDKDKWNSQTGKELEKTFLEPFPAIPQAEPMFDLVNIPYQAFNSIFKTHRNLVLTKFISGEKPRITVQENMHAYPQLVLTLIASDTVEMAKLVDANKEKIRGVIVKRERERLVDVYKKYEEKGIASVIRKKFNTNLLIPRGYALDLDSTDFVWIAHETRDISQGVFVYSYPYTDTTNFYLQNLIEKRNEILKRYVSASRKDSYMTTEVNIYPPEKREFFKDGEYVCEVRGLWKTVNDFMGGPFISYSMVDEKNGRIVTAEGYVYAPDKSKRNYVKQLETILSTMSIVKEDEQGTDSK